MKKIGVYTVRGQMNTSDTVMDRVTLFDGRFDTGFKVVGFEISNQDRDNTSAIVLSGKLCTEQTATTTSWNWGRQTEIAWSSNAWDANQFAGMPLLSVIDPDNMIIEDLFIGIYSGVDTIANYQIHLEKYDLTEWKGALSMVKNKSQA